MRKRRSRRSVMSIEGIAKKPRLAERVRTELADALRQMLELAYPRYELEAHRGTAERALQRLAEGIRRVPENRRHLEVAAHANLVMECCDVILPHLGGSLWRVPFGPLLPRTSVESLFIVWASQMHDDDTIAEALWPSEYRRRSVWHREKLLARVRSRRARALTVTRSRTAA